MICFSRNDLERIGEKVTVAYMRSREVSEDDVYQVDPEQVAQDLFHLSLAHFHLSSDRTVLGMTSPDEYWVEVFDERMESKFCCLDGKTILIEQDLLSETVPLGRYNFTVMHEVAHQILFYYSAREGQKVKFRQYPSCEKDWIEWQADTLAAALLMPERLVRKAMTFVALPPKIYLLDSLLCPEEFTKFRDAAAILGVSKTALAIRMKQLGLLEHSDLFRPGKIMDIFWEEGDTWSNKFAS